MSERVGPASDVSPGERKSIVVNGREITILNLDGEYYAVRSYCPHMGGPLGCGRTKDENENPRIACPFHNWEFDLESGDATNPLKARAETFDVQVVYDVDIEDGDLYIEI